MIIEVTQDYNELFKTGHRFYEDGTEIGTFYVEHKLQKDLGYIAEMEVSVFKETYYMKQAGLTWQPWKTSGISEDVMIAPYRIEKYGEVCGEIYEYTGSVLGVDNGRTLRKMNLNGCEYTAYVLGYGKAGLRIPVYKGNDEIALITKPMKVCNELHNFKIYALNREASIISGLFCGYIYVHGALDLHFHKPGKKFTKATYLYYAKTKAKEMLEKDDPAFESRCEQT